VTRLSAYLLIQPLVQDRRVLDLGCGAGEGAVLLQRAGAERVSVWEPDPALRQTIPGQLEQLEGTWPELAAESASFDVVLCADLLDRLAPEEHPACLREITRLLRPTGFAVISARNAERRLLGDTLAAGGGAQEARLDYSRFLQLLAEHFQHLALLGQSPMLGFYLSFLQPPTEATELSLCDDLVREPEEVSHFIGVASSTAVPHLRPYLLVTMPYYPEVEAVMVARQELEREAGSLRRGLRETAARLKDRETELLRLAGRTARLERLEEEASRGRQSEEQLLLTRGELERLAEEVMRQRAAGSGLRRELEDARKAGEDLVRRTTEAERAATEIALRRDQIGSRHEGLIAGHRELVAEYERLKIQQLEIQAELAARRREVTSLSTRLDGMTLEASKARDAAAAVREAATVLQRERDGLREALLALEERESRLRAERDARDAVQEQLELRVAHLQRELEEAGAELERLESLREAQATDQTARHAAEGELRGLRDQVAALTRALDETQERERTGEQGLGEARDRLDATTRELEQLRRSREALQRELGSQEEVGRQLEQQLQIARREASQHQEGARQTETEVQALRGEKTERERLIGLLEETIRDRDARLREAEDRAALAKEQAESQRQDVEKQRAMGAEALLRAEALATELEASRRSDARGQTLADSLSRELAAVQENLKETALALQAERSARTEDSARARTLAVDLDAARRAEAEMRARAQEAATERDAAQAEAMGVGVRFEALRRELDGLIEERERIIGVLRERAERTKTLEGELARTREEAGHRSYELEVLAARLQSVSSELERERQQWSGGEQQQERRVSELQQELENERAELREVRQCGDAAVATIVSERDRLRLELSQAGENHLWESADLARERDDLVGAARRQTEEVAALSAENARVTAELRAMEERSGRRDLELGIRATEFAEVLRYVEEMEKQVGAKSKEASRAAAQAGATAAEVAEASSRSAKLLRALEQERNARTEAEHRVEAKEEQRRAAWKEVAELTQRLQALEYKLQETRRQSAEARRELGAARDALERGRARTAGPASDAQTARADERPPGEASVVEDMPAESTSPGTDWENAPTRPTMIARLRKDAGAGRPADAGGAPSDGAAVQTGAAAAGKEQPTPDVAESMGEEDDTEP
jgi:chromosome segregation ATPase